MKDGFNLGRNCFENKTTNKLQLKIPITKTSKSLQSKKALNLELLNNKISWIPNPRNVSNSSIVIYEKWIMSSQKTKQFSSTVPKKTYFW
jgi:hypothetical protein